MKKITLSLVLVIFITKVIGQTPKTRTQSQDELLAKSRTLNTVATVMLIPGIASIGTGLIMDKGKYTPDLVVGGYYENQEKKEILVGVGAAIITSSIVMYAISLKSKHKARRISFNNNSLLYPKGNYIVVKRVPTLTFKFPL